MADPKPGVMAILGVGKKTDSEESSSSPEDEVKAQAFKDLASALKSGDATAGAEAFQRMYDACAESGYSSDESEIGEF